MKKPVSIFVIFAALICSSVVKADSPNGVLRLKLDRNQFEALKEKTVINKSLAPRYVLDPNETLVSTCSDNQELISATCDAVAPRAFGGDNFTHPIVTQTSIVTNGVTKQAECRALNLRGDDLVRLTMSLNCAPSKSLASQK